MFNYAQLIDQLNTQLEQFGYVSEDEITIPSATHISYVKNAAILKVRNLYVVLEVPSEIKENASAKIFFKKLKGSLLNKYGQAFLWKELEMCFVVVCEHDLYQALERDGGEAAAEAGFYLSSMMGTCFIDKTTFDYFFHSTWGLHFSGDHYKTIREVVTEWCEGQKNGEEKTMAS